MEKYKKTIDLKDWCWGNKDELKEIIKEIRWRSVKVKRVGEWTLELTGREYDVEKATEWMPR